MADSLGEKKVALITGAAGDIGFEVACRLDDMGYRLILIDINEDQLYQLSGRFKDSMCLMVDLTNRESLTCLLSRITDEFDHIELAFINAGVVCVGNVLDLENEKIDLQLELNLRSAIHLIKACATNMAARGYGHIISTVSMGGIVSLKGSATYSASKFGLRGFITAMRDELKPLGVSISGIYPSGVDTQMLRYEAQNGGSPLNFVSAPQSVEEVGSTVVKAMKSKKLEYYIPYTESLSARVLAFFPWVISYLYPILERVGQHGLNKYLTALKKENN